VTGITALHEPLSIEWRGGCKSRRRADAAPAEDEEGIVVTLQVYGPRAQQFVDLLSECCGLTLVLTGDVVTVSRDTLINPFESETLQSLVGEIIDSPNLVRIAAFSSAPVAGFYGDWFHANPGVQRPRRSVFVSDLQRVAGMSTILVRAVMGHILREYFGAARPPGHQPGQAFSHYHVPAIETEARVASDLTGRPIWTGRARPWEHTYGTINVRSYGPSLKFQLVMNGTGSLVRVIQPTGI
jgi:hypothetical protein